MTLSDAKAYVLYETRREKRITLRNLIIVVVLILIGIYFPHYKPTGHQCPYLCKIRTPFSLIAQRSLSSYKGVENP